MASCEELKNSAVVSDSAADATTWCNVLDTMCNGPLQGGVGVRGGLGILLER